MQQLEHDFGVIVINTYDKLKEMDIDVDVVFNCSLLTTCRVRVEEKEEF